MTEVTRKMEESPTNVRMQKWDELVSHYIRMASLPRLWPTLLSLTWIDHIHSCCLSFKPTPNIY